jgi:RNA polymerase sigma-70 factor (ECF subfamily)
MPILPKDPALLARFREGDREALEKVYWAYVDRVGRVVRHGFSMMRRDLGGAASGHVEGARPDEVADLVQETFLRAFAAPARLAYDGVRDYGPFLTTITRNLLVDRVRRLGRELSFDDLDVDWPDAPAEEEAPWADEAIMKVVRDYLAGLPDELRGVHEQRYVRGASQEESARLLGLSRQQLRTLEKRLREGLSEALERARVSI